MAGPKYPYPELVAAWRKEGSLERVAEQFGCSEATVRRAVHQDLGGRINEAIVFTDEERRLIEYLLEDGAPYTEVARTISENRGEEMSAHIFQHRWPGYGVQSPTERLEVARARRDFERLVHRLHLDTPITERKAS